MKVLLAGGSGFLGSHLAEELVKREYEVSVLDNLSSGIRDNLSYITDRITFIREDVTEFKTVEQFDYVINFASNASRKEWDEKFSSGIVC